MSEHDSLADFKALQDRRGSYVKGTLANGETGEVKGVEGWLDALGFIEGKIMVAIGLPDHSDGEIHFLPNHPATAILLQPEPEPS